MVAIHPYLVFSVVAGIAVAGRCRPESSASIATSEASVAASITETSLPASTTETTVSDLTTTTTAADSSTETTVTDSTTETGLTTFITSFTTTSAATTTVESATSTTSAAPVFVTCPTTTDQCLGTMKIQCDVVLAGLANFVQVADVNECAHMCDQQASCLGFTYMRLLRLCYRTTSANQVTNQLEYAGWDSGVKGTCGDQ